MKIAYQARAQKQFEKLDFSIQKKIKKFTDELESLENPRSRGKSLVGNLNDLWRYRVGDYRLICDIQDDKLIILILKIGHRSEVYRNG
ncbi:MAG: type II toxin-antitoxin system RelE/ParE family toxin [Campylobacteraceae bacterium]|jgi:mRNA interferase RelE/StbE|nr:type II toxin-antitoxin system RelE/ParE family toxin [Campylobacteraceae bacterium]